LVQRAVRAVDVVVLDLLGKDCFEMTATEDEHPVEALAPDGADDALADGVQQRCRLPMMGTLGPEPSG